MTSGGQAVTVAVRVANMVEVLKRIVGKLRVTVAESEVGEMISEKEETNEDKMVEEDNGVTPGGAIAMLADMTVAL